MELSCDIQNLPNDDVDCLDDGEEYFDHRTLLRKYERIEKLDRTLKQLINKLPGFNKSAWAEARNFRGTRLAEDDNNNNNNNNASSSSNIDYESLDLLNHNITLQDDGDTLLHRKIVPKLCQFEVHEIDDESGKNHRKYLDWTDDSCWKREEKLEDSAMHLIAQVRWEDDIIWDADVWPKKTLRNFTTKPSTTSRLLVKAPWENDIIWNSEGVKYKPRVNIVEHDRKDLEFNRPIPPDNLEASQSSFQDSALITRKRVFICNNRQHHLESKKPKNDIPSLENRPTGSKTCVHQTLEMFNISNDQFYTGKRPRCTFKKCSNFKPKFKAEHKELRCRACKAVGHRRNNRICPLFGSGSQFDESTQRTTRKRQQKKLEDSDDSEEDSEDEHEEKQEQEDNSKPSSLDFGTLSLSSSSSSSESASSSSSSSEMSSDEESPPTECVQQPVPQDYPLPPPLPVRRYPRRPSSIDEFLGVMSSSSSEDGE